MAFYITWQSSLEVNQSTQLFFSWLGFYHMDNGYGPYEVVHQ